MAFREHEKFWAFVALIIAIVGLAWLGTSLGENPTRSEVANEANEAALLARLRILDAAVAGLIGIAGMAAQALFRGHVEEKLADKLPPPTGEAAEIVREEQAAHSPVRPDSDGDGVPDEQSLPEGVRRETPSWDQ